MTVAVGPGDNSSAEPVADAGLLLFPAVFAFRDAPDGTDFNMAFCTLYRIAKQAVIKYTTH